MFGENIVSSSCEKTAPSNSRKLNFETIRDQPIAALNDFCRCSCRLNPRIDRLLPHKGVGGNCHWWGLEPQYKLHDQIFRATHDGMLPLHQFVLNAIQTEDTGLKLVRESRE